MAREGNVLADGAVMTSVTMDASQNDISAQMLRNSIYIRTHGISTTATMGHNIRAIDGADAAIATFVDASADTSCFDWIVTGKANALCAPGVTFDGFEDASINGTLWDTTNASSPAETGGYISHACNDNGGGTTSYINSKTNWGTGGSNITYMRLAIRCNNTSANNMTFALMASSAVSGGSEVTLWSVNSVHGGFDLKYLVDVWISGTNAYIRVDGGAPTTVSITSVAATWYLRMKMTNVYASYTPSYTLSYFYCYNVCTNLATTCTLNMATHNTYGTKNIGTAVVMGYYTPSSAGGTIGVAPKFSCDNGSNYVTKTGDGTTFPVTADMDPPFFFEFARTDYRGKCQLTFTNDNTNRTYPLVNTFGYFMRQ